MRLPRFATLVAVVGAVATAPDASLAHDFFLLPESFVTPSGDSIRLSATVSGKFPTREITVSPDRIAELRVESAAGAGKAQVLQASEKALDLQAQVGGAGMAVVAARLQPREVDYGEDRIDLIMTEYEIAPEMKQAVADLAKPRNLKVTSRRFAKALICVASCSDGSAALRPVGFDLEFVASGRVEREFRLLAAGRPLPDYPVAVATADGKRAHIRTGPDGAISVVGGPNGAVMLFAARLGPPAASNGRFTLDLTSLTFGAR